MRDEYNHLIPPTFTAPIAAKLLRTTPESLASLTRTGAIAALPTRTRYAREEIERILGRTLTIEEWLRADREHDSRREANRRYNQKRGEGVPGALLLGLLPTKGTA